MALIYLGCAWLAGIFLGSLLRLPSGFIGLLTSLPLVCLLLGLTCGRIRPVLLDFLSNLQGACYADRS